jgi:hypothetical protein
MSSPRTVGRPIGPPSSARSPDARRGLSLLGGDSPYPLTTSGVVLAADGGELFIGNDEHVASFTGEPRAASSPRSARPAALEPCSGSRPWQGCAPLVLRHSRVEPERQRFGCSEQREPMLAGMILPHLMQVFHIRPAGNHSRPRPACKLRGRRCHGRRLTASTLAGSLPSSGLSSLGSAHSDFSPSRTVGRFSLGVQIPRWMAG